MKQLLLLVLLLPLLCVAQKIPNHSNVIYLSGVSKEQFKDSLVKAGFTAIDHDKSSFVTLPRQYKVLEHGNLIIQAKEVAEGLQITGVYNLVAGDAVFAPYGNKWRQAEQTWAYSIQKEAFGILITQAKRMPGSYTCRKEKLAPVEVKN